MLSRQFRFAIIVIVRNCDMLNSRNLAEIIAHLGRVAYCEGFIEGLTSAQWAALRYFSRANRFSRTVSAFADFHSTTRGTASQTVKSLVAKGFLSRRRSQRDGRSIQLDVTPRGQDALKKDPFETLVVAVERLPESTRLHVGKVLTEMLTDMARDRGKRPFGVCTDCVFLRCEGCSADETPTNLRCGSMEEALGTQDMGQICVNFHPAPRDGLSCEGRGEARAMDTPVEGVPIP